MYQKNVQDEYVVKSTTFCRMFNPLKPEIRAGHVVLIGRMRNEYTLFV
jgi:hypothetical protein